MLPDVCDPSRGRKDELELLFTLSFQQLTGGGLSSAFSEKFAEPPTAEKGKSQSMKNIGRNPPRHPPKTSVFLVSKDITFRLKVRHADEALRLSRYLLTKFYARGESLTYDEEILLDLVLEYFRDLRRLDQVQKIGSSSNQLAVFSLMRLWASFRNSDYPTWAKAQVTILRKTARLLTPRAFLGMQGIFEVRSFVKLVNRESWAKPQPQRYIGVGYRDKGTAADVSMDGTPSWQEVAMQQIPESSLGPSWRELGKSAFLRLLTPYRRAVTQT